MFPGPLPQLVYVIRLWPSGSPEQPVWRSHVQNPLTGERHIFTDLADFFAFVEEQTQSVAPPIDQLAQPDSPDAD
ncbi:MAG: hypothetical protein KA765_13930 [Thermoflexales bacterium]|nr:hypothetical protein [Thermoflexales bacterium]